MSNKDRNGLIYTIVVSLVFCFAGLFDVLDYIIIKTLLISSVLGFLAYLIWIVTKNLENKKPLK